MKLNYNMSEFGDRNDQKIKTPEIKIDSQEIIFGIDRDFDEHTGSLGEACDVKDLDKIKALLEQNKFIENIVIRKGKNKVLLNLLERAVNALVQKEIGKDTSEILDVKELELVIKSGKLPPFAVAELAGAFYHLDREEECERLSKLIIACTSSAVGTTSLGHAYNTLGSLYLRQGDRALSLQANKDGLTFLNNQPNSDKNIEWQKGKLLHGTYFDRMDRVGQPTNQKEKKTLENVREKLFALHRARVVSGDAFNAPRVYLDAARICVSLKDIPRAREYAVDARDQMAQIGYWSGAEQASDLLREL